MNVLADFDGVAKDVDVLVETGKLPQIAQLLELGGRLRRWWGFGFGFDVAEGALSGGHGGDGEACLAATRCEM